jgi:TRAP-type C4-dicarboxylate transport system permease small subunit
MEKFIRLCDRISQAGGVLSGIMMIIGLLLVVAEIIVRTTFSKTLYITEEYCGYLMAAMTFLALAYTLKEKGHIRMVFLHSMVKGKARVILDIYAFVIGMVLCGVLTMTTADFFWDSLISNSRSMQISETYLAIPQFFLPLGSFVLTLQFVAEICRSVLRLRSGRWDEGETESSALGR